MKKLLTLMLALVMVLALVACANSNTNGNSNTNAPTDTPPATSSALPYAGHKIGYCPVTLTNSFLKWIADKLTYYCNLQGIEFYATEGELNIAVQIQQMENFIAMGCDVIIAQPTNLDAYESIVNQARDLGIKIIFWADDPPYDVEAFYLDNSVAVGTICGEMAVAWADKTFGKNAPAGSIKVAWLTTEYDDRPDAKTRQDAMIAAISDDPRFDVVFRKDNIRTAGDATAATNECLALNRDINVVFAFDAGYAIGANAAFMADKSLDYDKIAIFSVSTEEEMLKMVDLSATNDGSVMRGLVTFGEGDSYITKAVEVITGIIDGTVPLNSAYFCDLPAYNSVGYVSTYDPQEAARTYVKNTR